MVEGLTFGWRTAILVVAVAQIVAIAIGLLRTAQNRVANRLLAVLLFVLAGIVTPWMIGFAGFYDRWRWLTFVPVSITLAVAPLLYGYVHALVTGAEPPRMRWHLAPATAQLLFLAASFCLPLETKDAWSDRISPGYDRIVGAGTILGLLASGLADRRMLRAYRTALAGQRSDDHRFAGRWLGRAIAATLVLLPVWAGYTVWDGVAPLGYTGLMGLYVAIAAFALYLAVEGWRHAALPFPTLDTLSVADPPPEPTRDWRAQGEAWAATVRAAGWQSDDALTIAGLARLLGTNTGYLSRALNEGLGMNFSTFVNRLRCESVAAALRDGAKGDLLDLALEAGFSSKASFNRAFRDAFGVAPSAYRRQHGAKAE